jgi:hypothetical protein
VDYRRLSCFGSANHAQGSYLRRIKELLVCDQSDDANDPWLLCGFEKMDKKGVELDHLCATLFIHCEPEDDAQIS